MQSFINIANAEFGPGYTAGKCSLCSDEKCMRPHRTLTREGYALFLREMMEVESDEEAVRMADEEFMDGAGLRSFADMDEALGSRTGGDGGGWYGDGAQGDGYYTEADGVLDWEVKNEVIFLKKKWEEGLLKGGPRERQALRQRIKVAWTWRVGDEEGIYGRMPWDDISLDQLQDRASRPDSPGDSPLQSEPNPEPSGNQSRSRSPPRSNPTILPTQEEGKTTTHLRDEEYEKMRRRLYELWHREIAAKSPEDLGEWRIAMRIAWEALVGPKGKDESMPWDSDYVSHRPSSSSSLGPKDSSRSDERYESQKLVFTKEWEAMAHDKDATQRYAIARLIQAAFVTVVGTRSETEDMPWSADLQRSEPTTDNPAGASGAAGRRHSKSNTQDSLNNPLPGTSIDTDYDMLRAEYGLIFLNRIKGEEEEEVERVAGVFREAWVKEVGVRAHDVRMPWDEVLANQTDRVVDEREEREMLAGGGGEIIVVELMERGRDGGRRRREKRKVEGWTRERKGRGGGCEFQ